MKMQSRVMVGLALAGMLGAAGAATANNATALVAEQGHGSTQPGGAGADSGGTNVPQDNTAPVLHIMSVEVIRSAHEPALDVLRVRGVASSVGWEEAELVPLTRGVPADGVLQLVLVARAPTEVMDAKGFEVVEAIFPLEPAHPFKGVNVHSATDSVAVTQLPGYAESKFSAEDCSQCVGKTFVPRGAHAPAGVAETALVHEERLPSGTRVVKHSDGISSAESDPNRLTLILGKDGKVTAAVWD
jgi:hypothetical protein